MPSRRPSRQQAGFDADDFADGALARIVAGASAELHPAKPLAAGNAVPFYLAANRRLTRDVAAGELVTFDAIEIDPQSELLRLRRAQDAAFF